MNTYTDKKDKNLTGADIEQAAAICGSGKLGQCMICPLKHSPAVCSEVFARYIDSIRRLFDDEDKP